MKRALFPLLTMALGGLLFTGACGDDDDDDANDGRGMEETGQACLTPDDCFKNIGDRTQIQGTIECLERVRDGYCTHTCETDANCCAVEGECKTGLPQVCAPFESEEGRRCFLSCEDQVNEQEFCQNEAGTDFICRSSGGGDPRKVCVPGDCGVGSACDATHACDPTETCLTEFRGGYCGVPPGCNTNAECPANSVCVNHQGNRYCLKSCPNGPADCSFCRPESVATDCRSDVSFVEAGTAGSVCVPAAN